MASIQKIKELTDEELVAWIRDRDKEMYQELMRRYQDRALRYAWSIIKDRDRANDIVQKAFIRAFINLKSFNLKKKFSNWFFRIVHNQAINHIKKHRKEISFAGDEPWSQNIKSTDEPMEILLQNKESSLFIKQCLSDLPLNYRMPLELFYFEEKSYTDIGEILRLPMDTVSTRINRAKKMLKIIYTRATKLRHPEHMPQTVPRLDS